MRKWSWNGGVQIVIELLGVVENVKFNGVGFLEKSTIPLQIVSCISTPEGPYLTSQALHAVCLVVSEHSHPLWEESLPSISGRPPDADKQWVGLILSISAAHFSVSLSVSCTPGASGLRLPGAILDGSKCALYHCIPSSCTGVKLKCSAVMLWAVLSLLGSCKGRSLPEENELLKEGKGLVGGHTGVQGLSSSPSSSQGFVFSALSFFSSATWGCCLIWTCVLKAESSVCGTNCIFNKKRSFLGRVKLIRKNGVWFFFQEITASSPSLWLYCQILINILSYGRKQCVIERLL